MKPLIFVSLSAIIIINACRHSGDGDVTRSLKGAIDSACAKRLVNNFMEHERKGIIDSLKDTRSVWFSSKQLRSLLDRIDNENGNGIRFYFAAYDKDTTHKDIHVKKDYLGYSTLIMVSTRDTLMPNRKDTIRMDYFYDGPKRQGGIITATPENQGELCPPPNQCDSEGAKLLP